MCAATWPPLPRMLRCEGITPVLDQVAECLITADITHLVMGARQPDRRLRTMFEMTNARFIVALDDPRQVVAELFATTDTEFENDYSGGSQLLRPGNVVHVTTGGDDNPTGRGRKRCRSPSSAWHASST